MIVRQHVPVRPKATGKQLSLCSDELVYRRYRYTCLETNLTLPAHHVWTLYRGRADAENRIKELKYDFGAGSFNLRLFYRTEAILHFVMTAYNLVSLFRQVVLRERIQGGLNTLRYTVPALGSYTVREGNGTVLMVALPEKRRAWFAGLWAANDTMEFPWTVPT